MKLTIIPLDGAVYENGLSYSGLVWNGTPSNVHALQWDNESGWIEYNDGTLNENITSLPVWAENAMAAWTVANTPVPPPEPTPEEIQAQNLYKAKQLLSACDYTQLPDVNLANKTAWATYRNQVRAIANNPPITLAIFPDTPPLIWN
jgi:hypothetical protein